MLTNKPCTLCSLIMAFILLGAPVLTQASDRNTVKQSCTITLPFGSWTAQTQNGVGNVNATNPSVSITDLGNNQYSVSDFSGGFIGHFGFSDSNAATIEFDCNNAILSTSFDTDYGSCQITGGSWDPVTQELTIDWSLSNNRIIEVTKFTLN